MKGKLSALAIVFVSAACLGGAVDPYLPSHPHARSQESKIFGRVFFAFECVRTDFSSLTGKR